MRSSSYLINQGWPLPEDVDEVRQLEQGDEDGEVGVVNQEVQGGALQGTAVKTSRGRNLKNDSNMLQDCAL